MLAHLLKYLNLKVTTVTMAQLPKGFLSIGELANALNGLQVANVSVKLQVAQLSQINFPAVAHCQTEGKPPYFVLLKSFKNDNVSYFEEGTGEVTEHIAEFGKKWQGITLLLAHNAQSGEPNYEANRKAERLQTLQKAIGYGSLVAVGLWILSGVSTWQLAIWVLLQFGGLGICGLLMVNEFGQPSALITKLCHLNKGTNCTIILQSSASKLFGWLSLTEVGFLFFAGEVLALIISPQTPIGRTAFIFPLWCFGCIALPFTFWSVYYQWRVAKVWCALCLGVVAVLWLSFAIGLPFIQWSSASVPFEWVFGYLLAIGLWFLVKPFVLSQRKETATEQQLIAWQHNSDLFLSHLYAQPAIEINILPHEDQIGNPDAPVLVTMVSNPTCNPCQEAYQELSEWIHFFEDEMQLRIRHINTGEAKYDSHETFAKTIGLEYTPTIFINGHQLPTPYTFRDIKQHVRALAEQQV